MVTSLSGFEFDISLNLELLIKIISTSKSISKKDNI